MGSTYFYTHIHLPLLLFRLFSTFTQQQQNRNYRDKLLSFTFGMPESLSTSRVSPLQTQTGVYRSNPKDTVIDTRKSKIGRI